MNDEPTTDDLLTCPCGSQWFTFQEGISEKGKHAGAVALDRSGSVVAWSGRIVCIECGEHNTLPEPPLPTPSLRLVRPAEDTSEAKGARDNESRVSAPPTEPEDVK